MSSIDAGRQAGIGGSFLATIKRKSTLADKSLPIPLPSNRIVKMVRLIFLLVIVGLASADSRSRYYDEEERIAAEVFEHGKGYLKHLAPPPDVGHHHTNVTVNLYVRNVFSIGEKSHIWKVQLTFRQEWQDTRLAHKSELDGWDYLVSNYTNIYSIKKYTKLPILKFLVR